MAEEELLFNNATWFGVQSQKIADLDHEVGTIEANRLLNTSVEDLVRYLVEKYWFEVPTLLRDDIEADQREIQVDVSRDPNRAIRDRSRSFHIPGTRIELHVPFAGDAAAFKIQPSIFTMNPPRGRVSQGVLFLVIAGADLNPNNVKASFDRQLTSIDEYLTNLRKDVAGFNSSIEAEAKDRIESRRSKLLANQNLVSSLGFKIKQRDNALLTYTSPTVRRKVTPVLPAASSAPYKPEPAMASADYEHILSVLENMAHVMERSPSAFKKIDEESLRTHFLVQLNGHYEGQATGETFNYSGKTDILIRVEGKNIFIGECKYWGGPVMLTDTLNQVLGYSSWRDTKVAVIVFNRNKDFTKVLDAIKTATKEHPSCKRDLGNRSETSFRYVFAHRDDPNREMTVTVMAFDVPT